MRALDEGESFVINRNGHPVGELVPLRRHRFVDAAAAVEMFRGAPRVDAAALRRDLIASAALAAGIPLVTRNAADVVGLEGLVDVIEV